MRIIKQILRLSGFWLLLALLLTEAAAQARSAHSPSSPPLRPTSPHQVIVGSAINFDGDTLAINRIHIRLFGIDAPETEQTCRLPTNRVWQCGREAGDFMKSLIAGQSVTCRGRDIDQYRRLVAVCFITPPGTSSATPSMDLGKMMVARGWALAYRRFSLDYAADEDAARAKNLGIWASRFEFPWRWRKSHPRSR